MRHRGTAVAIALFCAALATVGCGIGAGEGVGEVSLTVTREFGAEPVLPALSGEASESDTVMRVLDREAEIATRYGDGFVQAIDGLEAERAGGLSWDWFFYVNGVLSPVGAADYELHGGEAIWWDYHEWSVASQVSAVVGSWPRPLVGGYDGERRPVIVECRGGGAACGLARQRLTEAGVELADSPDGAIRVLVGPWARLRDDPAAAQLERGPRTSGVFAQFAAGEEGFSLIALDERGDEALELGPDAGLVAATRRYDAPPVWLVTGVSARGALAAAGLLDEAHLRDRYAVATEGGEETPLPVR